MIEFFPGTPGDKYRPGNGDEGYAFDSVWCDRCQCDKAYRETQDPEDGCLIIANVWAYQIGDDSYPSEWVYGDDGQPTCKKFQEVI